MSERGRERWGDRERNRNGEGEEERGKDMTEERQRRIETTRETWRKSDIHSEKPTARDREACGHAQSERQWERGTERDRDTEEV